MLGELLAQGGVGSVLDIHVDCSHHVHTVAGNDIRVAMYGSREARRDALAQHTAILSAQVVGIYILQAILSAGALLILIADISRNTAQRTAAQLAIGIYTLVEDMFLIGYAHIVVQDGVLAQRLPLVEVHRAGQNLHGVMVTHGGINLENLHIVATQVIHNPREEVATAPNKRVVRIYPLAVFLALVKHHAAILGRGAVLEEGREQLRERIDILTKDLIVVEALATHIEVDAVAQDRGGQRLAIACKDRASARDDGIALEDTTLKTGGILGRLGDGQHNPHKAQNNAQAQQDENPMHDFHLLEHIFSNIFSSL